MLLLRSFDARPSPGRWAAVSGYVTRELLDQSYLEIEKQCGYTRGNLKLAIRGEPLDVQRAAGRLRVYPLLFDVLTDAEPRLDGESPACRWVEPHELSRLKTVSRLWEAWQRLLAAEDKPYRLAKEP